MLNGTGEHADVRVRHSAEYRPPLRPAARRPLRASVTLGTIQSPFRLDAPAFQPVASDPASTATPRYDPLSAAAARPPPLRDAVPALEPYDGAYFAPRGTHYAPRRDGPGAAAPAPLFVPGRNSAPARTTPQQQQQQQQQQQHVGERTRRSKRHRARVFSVNLTAPSTGGDSSSTGSSTGSSSETATTTPSSTATVSPTSQQQQQQQQQRQGTLKPELYKTELCRKYEETGSCRYGAKCQFAHGEAELRPVQRHPLYKTEPCRMYHQLGHCNYGTRCRFIHESPDEGQHPGRAACARAPSPAPPSPHCIAVALALGGPAAPLQRRSLSALTVAGAALATPPLYALLATGTPPTAPAAPLTAALSQPTSPESPALVLLQQQEPQQQGAAAALEDDAAAVEDAEREQERRLVEQLEL